MDKLLKNVLSLIGSRYSKDSDFEKEFGVAKSTVSAWRRGVLKSYKNKAPELAEFFCVSLDDLIGSTNKNKPATANGNELNEKLLILEDVTQDFSPEEWAKLMDYAALLKASQSQLKK